MRGLTLFLGVAAMLYCCGIGNCNSTALYQLSSKQKPVVAVLPIIDRTQCQYGFPWDVSREFTDEIRNRVFQSKRITLLCDDGSLEIAKKLSVPNPRGILPEAIREVGAAEFAFVAELIEQDDSSFANLGTRSSFYNRETPAFALRIRVLDLRQVTAKVVLQEILKENAIIVRSYMPRDYAKTPWGTEAFLHTPMGVAHHRLVKEVVSRLEAYIEASI
jgi:hypothetical protein